MICCANVLNHSSKFSTRNCDTILYCNQLADGSPSTSLPVLDSVNRRPRGLSLDRSFLSVRHRGERRIFLTQILLQSDRNQNLSAPLNSGCLLLKSTFLHDTWSLRGPFSRSAWQARCLTSTRASRVQAQHPCTSEWKSILPQPLKYSSRQLALSDLEQLSALWAKTLKQQREPARILIAMRHSYAYVIVHDESVAAPSGSSGKLIGVGRAVSDGSFVATICDVAVDPEYQGRGVGRRIVKRLVQDMKGRGPTGFVVFPPPTARRFFWMLGFRIDRKYQIMAYRGNLSEASGKEPGKGDESFAPAGTLASSPGTEESTAEIAVGVASGTNQDLPGIDSIQSTPHIL